MPSKQEQENVEVGSGFFGRRAKIAMAICVLLGMGYYVHSQMGETSSETFSRPPLLEFRPMTIDNQRPGSLELSKFKITFEKAGGFDSAKISADDRFSLQTESIDAYHCFVILMRPDGKVVLCSPDSTKDKPIAVKNIDLGFDGRHSRISESKSTGLCGIFLVAAIPPLPSFDDWLAARPPCPWKPTKLTGDTRWQITKGKVVATSANENAQKPNDPEIANPELLNQVKYWLSTDPSIKVIEGKVFNVQGR